MFPMLSPSSALCGNGTGNEGNPWFPIWVGSHGSIVVLSEGLISFHIKNLDLNNITIFNMIIIIIISNNNNNNNNKIVVLFLRGLYTYKSILKGHGTKTLQRFHIW